MPGLAALSIEDIKALEWDVPSLRIIELQIRHIKTGQSSIAGLEIIIRTSKLSGLVHS